MLTLRRLKLKIFSSEGCLLLFFDRNGLGLGLVVFMTRWGSVIMQIKFLGVALLMGVVLSGCGRGGNQTGLGVYSGSGKNKKGQKSSSSTGASPNSVSNLALDVPFLQFLEFRLAPESAGITNWGQTSFAKLSEGVQSGKSLTTFDAQNNVTKTKPTYSRRDTKANRRLRDISAYPFLLFGSGDLLKARLLGASAAGDELNRLTELTIIAVFQTSKKGVTVFESPGWFGLKIDGAGKVAPFFGGTNKTSTTIVTDNNTHIISIIKTPTKTTIRVNGNTEVNAQDDVFARAAANDYFQVGSFSGGSLGELLLYNKALSPANLDTAECVLGRDRYLISLGHGC